MPSRDSGITADQVCREVDKVCVVLVDELHHGCFEQLVVQLQVISQLFQLHPLPTVRHKVIHVEILLKVNQGNGCNGTPFT